MRLHTVAVALTIGRPSARGFLGCVSRQTMPLRTLLWVDDVPGLTVNAEGVHVVYGPRVGSPHSIGLVRREACAYAIEQLGADALLMLDDDDYYAPEHFSVLAEALDSGAEWVSARRFGVADVRRQSWSPAMADDTEGTGPASTWAMRTSVYLESGGYRDDRLEELELGRRVGWERLTRHDRMTHVRLLGRPQLSLSVGYDRAALRERFEPVELFAQFPVEYQILEKWCSDAEGGANG